MGISSKTLGVVVALAALAALPAAASAGVTVADTYYGGLNTYNNSDVVGDLNVFDIKQATFERLNAGATLRVTIETNYAGAPGTQPALGTGYGDLFFKKGSNAWSPDGGNAPHYDQDVYDAGDWTYAFTMPFNPTLTSDTGYLYSIAGNGLIDQSHVGTSYSGGNFRNNQAVEFNPSVGATTVGSGVWTVDATARTITFDINDGGALGNSFAFSWAMTCANDVIQGQVTGVPEPATWALLIAGFGGVGAQLRRRRAALA